MSDTSPDFLYRVPMLDNFLQKKKFGARTPRKKFGVKIKNGPTTQKSIFSKKMNFSKIEYGRYLS